MLSTYKEFSEEDEARRAVRALRQAGFEFIETEDLSHPLLSKTDVEPAPARKTWSYVKRGIAAGGTGGLVLGLLLFWLPEMITSTPYTMLVILFGVVTCVAVGVTVGVLEALILSSRAAEDPTGVSGRKPVGVLVRAENSVEIKKAAAILAEYGERPRQSFKEWLARHTAYR